MNSAKMNLLLIYPQLADKPKRRISRESAQFVGLTQSTRALLEQGKTSKLSVQASPYNSYFNDVALHCGASAKPLASLYKDADVVIDISPPPLIHMPKLAGAAPIIHLSPTFRGSFACNEINIKGFGAQQQSDIVKCISQNRDQITKAVPSTHELSAQMRDSAFTPLPTRVGDAFYRTQKEHALVLLAYPEHSRNDQTIATDIQVLRKILKTIKDLKSISFMCECLEEVQFIQQVADGVKLSLGIQTSVWGLRKGEFQDMFAIMAKSSVVFFGGSALFLDAIICNIPVFPWRVNLPGSENIAQAYRQFSTHAKPDRNKLMQGQQKQFHRLIETQYLDSTVPNNRACFHSVLSDLINLATQRTITNAVYTKKSQPQRVIPPAQISNKRGMPDQISRSVWSDRRKLLQFKQPANRQILQKSSLGELEVFTHLNK